MSDHRMSDPTAIQGTWSDLETHARYVYMYGAQGKHDAFEFAEAILVLLGTDGSNANDLRTGDFGAHPDSSPGCPGCVALTRERDEAIAVAELMSDKVNHMAQPFADAEARVLALTRERDEALSELGAMTDVAAEYLESSDANYDRAEKAERDLAQARQALREIADIRLDQEDLHFEAIEAVSAAREALGERGTEQDLGGARGARAQDDHS